MSAVSGGVCLKQDGDFSEQRFRDIVNAFLANSVGNLLNRTLGLLRKNCAGALPAAAAAVPADNPLRAVAELEARCRPKAYLHVCHWLMSNLNSVLWMAYQPVHCCSGHQRYPHIAMGSKCSEKVWTAMGGFLVATVCSGVHPFLTD